MTRKTKRKPGIGMPNPNITAARHSGKAGVQIRRLLREMLPDSIKSLAARSKLPYPTVWYHINTMMSLGELTVRKLPGKSRPYNCFERKVK